LEGREPSLIQILQHNVVVDETGLSELRLEFAERHCVMLRQMVSADLLERLSPLLAKAPAQDRASGTAPDGRVFAREMTVEHSAIVAQAFALLFNKPAIFRYVEQITGCSRIGCFDGRIYMMRPGSNHYDEWHTDNDGSRLVGLSLNLTPELYEGGIFQIRERRSGQVVEIANTIRGDAHIFRIARGFRHRVTLVTGIVTKTAFAGWFRAEPESKCELQPEN
jgi:hypothetical protein